MINGATASRQDQDYLHRLVYLLIQYNSLPKTLPLVLARLVPREGALLVTQVEAWLSCSLGPPTKLSFFTNDPMTKPYHHTRSVMSCVPYY